jgi:hypothetical protein
MSTTFAEQFAVFKNQKVLLVALLFLFVIVIFWTGLSLFGSQTKFAVPPEMRELAKPLTPSIKGEVLTRIEAKRQFSSDELVGFTIYKILDGKGSADNKPRLVDINYVEEEEVSVGTVPSAASGGLSTFLQTNPDFETAETETIVPDEQATEANQAQEPEQPSNQNDSTSGEDSTVDQSTSDVTPTPGEAQSGVPTQAPTLSETPTPTTAP